LDSGRANSLVTAANNALLIYMPAENYDLKVIAIDQVYPAIPLEELLQWINEGRVAPRDFVRPVGQEQWLPVSSVPEFASLLEVFGGPDDGAFNQPDSGSPDRVEQAVTSPLPADPAPVVPTAIPITPVAAPVATPVAAGAVSQSRNWTYDDSIYGMDASQGPADLDEEIGASTNVWPKYEIEEGSMDMLPMIDVIFQLLIFFMFTTQAANPSPIEAPESVTGVGINEAGVQMVLIDKDHRLYLGGKAIEENRRETAAALAAEIEQNANDLGNALPVVINAHKQAKHGVVMNLHKMLVKIPTIGKVKYGVEEKK